MILVSTKNIAKAFSDMNSRMFPEYWVHIFSAVCQSSMNNGAGDVHNSRIISGTFRRGVAPG